MKSLLAGRHKQVTNLGLDNPALFLFLHAVDLERYIPRFRLSPIGVAADTRLFRNVSLRESNIGAPNELL